MIPHSTPFDVTQAYEYTPCSSFGVPFSSSSTGLIKMPQASKSLTLEPNPEVRNHCRSIYRVRYYFNFQR
jgi:hypothetical protein